MLELESRAAVSVAGTHKRLRATAACSVTAHDHDLFALESAEVERRAAVNQLKAGLGNHCLKISVITTNLFSHPISKHGVFTNNVGEDCRFDLRQALRKHSMPDISAESTLKPCESNAELKNSQEFEGFDPKRYFNGQADRLLVN